ncbi:MAG: TPM domain-containing protein [Atopobiaceae bacterium]|nr:TPM domain-containing protein [Atopobiaceae bacterium]
MLSNKKVGLISILAAVLFAVLMIPTPAYARSGSYVFDERDVLSTEEFNTLESKAAEYADEYNVGVYLLFTDHLGSNEGSGSGRNEFGKSYFLQHDLGVSPNGDGIILAVAVDARKYVSVKHFIDSSTDPFSDDSVDEMESEVKSCLKDDEWGEAAQTYYNIVGEHMAYFKENGKQWREAHVIGTILKGAATVLIPLMIAFGVVSSERNAMKTARMQTEANNYLDIDTFKLRVRRDTFVNRSISAVPIPKNDDNDSGGGWSDMGGGFSGSGGGDF